MKTIRKQNLTHWSYLCIMLFYVYQPHQFQIDSSTIDGNVEFVHSQYYSCILTSQVSTQFLCPTKL